MFISIGASYIRSHSFFIELWTMNVSNFEIARSITLTSVIYFSFTLLEMSITNALKDKDSSYFIGVNLGFSLLRMILTIVILFICKRNDSFDFALIFINLAAFYILTLAFSAWHRTKLSTK